MFAQLKNLLQHTGDTVSFTLAREKDDRLRVVILPKLHTRSEPLAKDRTRLAEDATRNGLNHPLVVTGTTEELDSPAFVEQITRFTTSAVTAANDIASVEAEHKRAVEAAKKKPVTPAKPASKPASKPKPVAKKPTPAKPATKPTTSSPPKPAPKPSSSSTPASRIARGKDGKLGIQPAAPAATPTPPTAEPATPAPPPAPAPPPDPNANPLGI
jgi:PRTRC genetic system protein E